MISMKMVLKKVWMEKKVNQIIEEIIEIMRKNKITVGTALNYFRRYDFLNNKRHSYHIECSNISRKK